MKRGTPLAIHYRLLRLSEGKSCQPSWDVWRGVVMEGKGKKQNPKIKARYQWYGHQRTRLGFCTPCSHWLAEHLVTCLHLYVFQHPNHLTQRKPFLGKCYELHPPSAISEAAMAICTAFTDGSEKGQVCLHLPIKNPLYIMSGTCGELRSGKVISELTGVIMMSVETVRQVLLGSENNR